LSGAAPGNVPQAFTNVGLINAALSPAEREKAPERTTQTIRQGAFFLTFGVTLQGSIRAVTGDAVAEGKEPGDADSLHGDARCH
jgi:hypothetical protein